MQNLNIKERYEQYIASLKAEKEELAMIVSKEQSQMSQLKQDLADVEAQKSELTKASKIAGRNFLFWIKLMLAD